MSSRTQILVLGDTLRFGGAERHSVVLANALDRTRHDVHFAYLKPMEALRGLLDDTRLASVLCLDVRSKLDRAAIARLASHLREQRIDAVLCSNPYAMLHAVAARRQAGRPDLQVVEIYHTTLLGTWKDRLQMLYYWPVFRQCDALVYVSRNQQQHWRRLGLRARRDLAICNGVDIEHYRDRVSAAEKAALRTSLGFGADDYVIGICAALRPEKAHGDLLVALQRLRARGVPARVLIIGDGPERASIEQQIARLGIGDVVRITGLQQDVRPCMTICDVLALVSHAVETFSLAILESMALGKPVVASRIGGASEQIEDGASGCLFEAGDLDALTDALIKLSDDALRRHFGARAREKVAAEYSLQSMMQGYEDLLETLPRPAW